MRHAVLDVWGEAGLAVVAAHVSADTRAQTVEASVSPLAWVPERFLIEWHEATWHHLARHDDAALCRTIDRRLDFGFGRVRKALLGLVGPEGVIRRAAELWRHDHTHGTLVMEVGKDGKSLTATLSDHAFCEHPIARRALAETFRYIGQLCRGVKEAKESHWLDDGAAVVRVSWR
jgi:hypothetical protein